ncbi:ATP-binding protein, partial [Nocardioides hankookensis]
MHAQVIVLAGPSGAGKSRLAERVGLPVLRLDDFYKSAGDPSLPLITEGANAGIVDWDVPESWLLADAMAALDELCRTGRTEVPVYDISLSARTGWQTLDLGEHRVFVAEGIFAQEVVGRCETAGLHAAAYCVRQHPMVTFWRRLT